MKLLLDVGMVLAVIVILVFAVPHLSNERLRRRGVRVMGVCIAHSAPVDQKVSCRIQYRIGEDEVTFTTSSSSAPAAQIGQQVEVLYDRENPKRAGLAYQVPPDGTKVRVFLLVMFLLLIAAFVVRVLS
ncbi:DUF3592 domain-containing protein [Streptomyces sp. NBC_00727]|uniref:DUF3592 domain-containing protein n=1 Tax=Streptomyces sp. NBC_00727 TaxID=2903675 RepID=UPI003867A32F